MQQLFMFKFFSPLFLMANGVLGVLRDLHPTRQAVSTDKYLSTFERYKYINMRIVMLDVVGLNGGK